MPVYVLKVLTYAYISAFKKVIEKNKLDLERRKYTDDTECTDVYFAINQIKFHII